MAKKSFEIKGFKEVRNNLVKEIKKLDKKSIDGIIEAAAYIRVDMDATSPTIPVDLGNLRGSWFTTFIKFRGVKGLIMGFNANYAVWVHENVDAKFQRPGSGAKFFESALKRNINKILKIIAKNTKIS